jgi:hypothetical protein
MNDGEDSVDGEVAVAVVVVGQPHRQHGNGSDAMIEKQFHSRANFILCVLRFTHHSKLH